MYFPSPPLEAALSILNVLFLIYSLLMMRWSPKKKLTNHQTLVRSMFNVY
jgi:hypothetical protein